MSDFDIEFEDEILSAALRDDAFLKRAARICEAHHFGTPEHSWIWKTIHDVWKSYHERATGKLIVAKARAEFKDPKKRKPYISLATKLIKGKPVHPKAALDELGKFVRSVNLQIALEKSAKALDDGKLDEAESAVQTATRGVAKERKYSHVQWVEEFDDRQASRKYEKEHPDEFRVVPTGLPTLDAKLGGGSRIGELNLVMGTTGRGKSVFCTNVTQAAVSRAINTLYIGTEMPARQLAARQDSRWTQLRYDQFKKYDFSPSELRQIRDRLKRETKRFKNRLHIISYPVRSASIDDIYGALEDLQTEHGFRPDLIVMDSGDHLRSTDTSLKDYRLQQADVYWELSRLAEESGHVVWSSVQAGKEYANQTATAEGTSESYDKARIADLIVSLNDPLAGKRGKKVEIEEEDPDEDDEDELEGEIVGDPGMKKLELFLAKYRDGESKLKIPIDGDFARMTLRESKPKEEED